MLLGDWLEKWLEMYVDPSTLAQSTKACYHRAVDAVPTDIRQRDLSSISALDILPWLLDVARVHPRAAQLDRVMLSRALTIAAKLKLCDPGIIDPDTCPKPAHQPAKAQVMTRAQFAVYTEAAARTDVAPALLFCCCGLRRGEALGVRWEDLNLAEGTLMIRGQRLRQKDGYLYRPLKSASSYRQLQLPGSLVQLLRSWPRSLSGWVCDTTPEHLQTVHRKTIKAQSLPHVTLHGLRHTFATLTVMNGISMKRLQGALGHAKYSITADLYADHLPPLSTVPFEVIM